MYADDTVIYAVDKDFNRTDQCLNKYLRNTSDYYSTNKLIINLNKGMVKET